MGNRVADCDQGVKACPKTLDGLAEGEARVSCDPAVPFWSKAVGGEWLRTKGCMPAQRSDGSTGKGSLLDGTIFGSLPD